MSIEDAVKLLKADDEHEGFLEQFMIMDRMKSDKDFKEGVIEAMRN